MMSLVLASCFLFHHPAPLWLAHTHTYTRTWACTQSYPSATSLPRAAGRPSDAAAARLGVRPCTTLAQRKMSAHRMASPTHLLHSLQLPHLAKRLEKPRLCIKRFHTTVQFLLNPRYKIRKLPEYLTWWEASLSKPGWLPPVPLKD